MGGKHLTELEFGRRARKFLPDGIPETAIEAVESDAENKQYWVFLHDGYSCPIGVGGHTIITSKLSDMKDAMKQIRVTAC